MSIRHLTVNIAKNTWINIFIIEPGRCRPIDPPISHTDRYKSIINVLHLSQILVFKSKSLVIQLDMLLD